MAKGTMSFEDIYGAGSLDTLSGQTGETNQLTNPNNSDVTGAANPKESSLFHIQGKFLGQPIMVWIGMLLILGIVKVVVEKGAK